jgi:hypothetical protein
VNARAAKTLASVCLFSTLAVLFSPSAFAQCGAKRSTCSGCHDGARASLPAPDAWHDDHAFADLCASCHGGNGESDQVETAHGSLSDPLAKDGEACISCHGTDTKSLLVRYRPRNSDAGHPNVTTSSTPPGSPPPLHGQRKTNLALAGLTLGIGVFGIFFIVRNERRRV